MDLFQGEDGKKIKTRSGESVRLKELLDEAIANAERDISRRLNASFDTKETDSNDNFTLSNEYKDIAATVGLAAVKYADLSLNRLSDYRFSFDRMLSLTGNTAPYMLYAYVRIRGIQRKAEVAANESIPQEKFDNKVMIATDFLLNTSEEISLAKQILKLEEVLLEISQDYYPNKVKFFHFFSYRISCCHSFLAM
jgi:arginyl-tRNA synthetase